MDPQLLAYFTVTTVLVLTPGSTTAVVVRNTLEAGRSGGLAAAAGAALGNGTHASAAGIGLAVMFARWPLLLMLLRAGGAAYLAWLGAQSLWRALPGSRERRVDAQAPVRGRDYRGSFRQGLTVNLLNPAIATFYLVVVPSFTPPGSPWSWFALLAAIHVTMAFAWHLLWAVGLDGARRLFAHAAVRRALEVATGLALIALALHIVVS